MRRKSTIYDKTNNSINIWPEMELFKRQFDRHSTYIQQHKSYSFPSGPMTFTVMGFGRHLQYQMKILSCAIASDPIRKQSVAPLTAHWCPSKRIFPGRSLVWYTDSEMSNTTPWSPILLLLKALTEQYQRLTSDPTSLPLRKRAFVTDYFLQSVESTLSSRYAQGVKIIYKKNQTWNKMNIQMLFKIEVLEESSSM